MDNIGAEVVAAGVGGAAEDGPGSPLARAGRADMQQSEEYELLRGEHSVAQGPTEQLLLFSTSAQPTSRDFAFISSTFARRSTYFSPSQPLR